MKYVDYKAFIEENFMLINKEGETIPFIFNNTQNHIYSELEQDYPDFKGIRENWLKFRQWGGSTFVVAMFTTDFILSELGEMPLSFSDVYSHKDDETSVHFNRMSYWLDCWISKSFQTDNYTDIYKLRKQLLKTDEQGNKVEGMRGSAFATQTAGAKVSGRGGTKQNLLFTEIAFYPNTEVINAKKLVVGASKQVKDGYGKIFRESTGNLSGDYWHSEYEIGKDPLAEYKSRFLGWWLHHEYSLEPPAEWQIPEYYNQVIFDYGVTRAQCYWHFRKTRGLTDLEELREYPTYDVEAFLLGGDPYFEKEAINYYSNQVIKPIKVASELNLAHARI